MLKKLLNPATINSIKRWVYTLFKFAHYAKWLKKDYIDNKAILLESQQGNDINGNMFYILQEIAQNPQYKDYTIYFSCRRKSKSKIKTILDNYKIKNVTLAPKIFTAGQR